MDISFLGNVFGKFHQSINLINNFFQVHQIKKHGNIIICCISIRIIDILSSWNKAVAIAIASNIVK